MLTRGDEGFTLLFHFGWLNSEATLVSEVWGQAARRLSKATFRGRELIL